MNEPQASRGPGRFQWNAGGWFGSQLGGTTWLFVGAMVLATRALDLAAIWLACFLGANLAGLWLWSRRDRIAPFAALELLLAVCGIAGLAALGGLELFRPELAFQLTGMRHASAVLLGVPLLMAWFLVLEQGERRRRAREDHGTEAGGASSARESQA
jgi:hypothetical protein